MKRTKPGKAGQLRIPLLPMEAAIAAEIPRAPAWQFEPKWDGFRCIVFRRGNTIVLQSKSGKKLSRYFPDVCADLAHLRSQRFVLDGEIIIDREDGSGFNDLLQRIHPAASRIKKLATETPASLVVFDILELEGRVLVSENLDTRRSILDKFAEKEFRAAQRITLSPMTLHATTALRWLRGGRGAWDGVIAKLRESPYLSAERTAMVKVKRRRTADCVVGGFRYAEGGRTVASLLLGLYDRQGRLNHVGYTSTIPRADRAALTKTLEKLIQKPGFTGKAPGGPSRWSTKRSAEWQPLRPKLVAEVEYDQFTADRFRHGTKFLRWRPDKAAKQCVMSQIEAPRTSKPTRPSQKAKK